ncbi:calcium-binding protein [Amaricoccus solimangrovi]|uniref:calcium-binding protein n=1 Tax=Amaricoccus solimangrovi TaxID=2589815 RepID=UPI0027955F8A|nr:calcium-binding protein [Amaricoccus solimangrovi]
MATLTIESDDVGFDISAIDFSGLYYAENVRATSVRYELVYGNGAYDEFRGHGFRYNDNLEPTAGTVSQYRTYFSGMLATATGLEIGATDIRDAAQTFSTRDDLRVISDAFHGDDLFEGGGGRDRLRGYDGDDTLRGGNGWDSLFGAEGDDALQGGSGKDRLYGNEGNDTLVGGRGADFLLGKDGADIFRFDAKLSKANLDKISDFVHAEDTIQLAQDVFDDEGDLGQLDKKALYRGAEAHDSTDRVIHDSTTGALYFDPDGTGDAAQIQFAVLGRGIEITTGDFQIIT